MNPKHVLVLCDLADAVLDSDDAGAYCKGLKTTPRQLSRLADAVRAACGELPRVYAVLRNEEENNRRCFLGVYRTLDAAEAFIRDDLAELEGVYERDDYDVLPTNVDDYLPEGE